MILSGLNQTLVSWNFKSKWTFKRIIYFRWLVKWRRMTGLRYERIWNFQRLMPLCVFVNLKGSCQLQDFTANLSPQLCRWIFWHKIKMQIYVLNDAARKKWDLKEFLISMMTSLSSPIVINVESFKIQWKYSLKGRNILILSYVNQSLQMLCLSPKVSRDKVQKAKQVKNCFSIIRN